MLPIRDTIPRQNPPIATWLLILANGIIFFFELPAVVYLGFWALSQVLSGTLSLATMGSAGGIAWWAHVGGFATGIVLHFLFIKRGGAYRWPARDEYQLESAWVPAGHWRSYR